MMYMIEKSLVALNRLLGRIWMLKVLLMRDQKELKNILLKTRGKVIFIIYWQKSLSRLSPTVLFWVFS